MISGISIRTDKPHRIARLAAATAIAVLAAQSVAASDDTMSQSMPHNMAQSMDHSAMTAPVANAAADSTATMPTEGGQSAFAAIHEIIEILRADPNTDWSKVDIERLRRHLIDMDAVTLRAQVAATAIDDGAIFAVSSGDPAVVASIRAMVMAHAKIASGTDAMQMAGEKTETGARLTVTGPDVAKIRGLGFIGVLATGMHHQPHHLALARGANPH